MSTMLAVRAFNRTQTIRLGGKEPQGTLPAGQRSFVLVNADNPRVIRDLGRHSAIGSIYPVGNAIWQNDDGVISGGGAVTVRATGLTVDVGTVAWTNAAGTAGSAAAQTVTVGTADATNPRVDMVVLNTSTGAATVVAGTAVAGAQLSFPAAPTFRGTLGTLAASRITLAYILVPATATNLVQTNVLDARP